MWLDCIIKWGHFLSHRINKTYRSIIVYKLLLVLVVNHIEKKQFLEKRKFKVMFRHFGRSSPYPPTPPPLYPAPSGYLPHRSALFF